MLEDQIRKRFERHIKHGRIITAPEELLAAVLKETAKWLKEHQRYYHAAFGLGAAEAVRDLRLHLLKSTRTSRLTQ